MSGTGSAGAGQGGREGGNSLHAWCEDLLCRVLETELLHLQQTSTTSHTSYLCSCGPGIHMSLVHAIAAGDGINLMCSSRNSCRSTTLRKALANVFQLEEVH